MGTIDTYAEQLGNHIEAIRSHSPEVEKSATEGSHQQTLNALANIQVAVHSMAEAIEQDRLRSLPVLLVSELVPVFESAANTMANAAGDFDPHHGELANIANKMHRRLWEGRLLDPAMEVKQYQRVQGDLERLRDQAAAILAELKDATTIKERAVKARDEAKQAATESADAKAKTEAAHANVEKLVKETAAVKSQAESDSEATSVALTEIQDSRKAVKKLEADITAWHGEMESRQNAVEKLKQSTEKRLERYESEILERTNTLDEFEKRINDQFKLASSGALAKAFESKSGWRSAAMWLWGSVAVLSYVGSVVVTAWQAHVLAEEFGDPKSEVGWEALVVRASVGIAIVALVWFVTVQFGRAMRIKESYAFKATVASSFDAHRTLIEEITKDPQLTGNAAYANFIREVIAGLYKEPPLGKEEEDHPPHARAARDAAEVLKQVGVLFDKAKR